MSVGSREISVGGKGGYLHESVLPPVFDKDVWNACKTGQAYAGPTARIRYFIPGTQYKTGPLAGLGIGAQAEYDAIHNQIAVEGTISYTF